MHLRVQRETPPSLLSLNENKGKDIYQPGTLVVGRVEQRVWRFKKKASKLLNPRGYFISAFLGIVGPHGRGTSVFYFNT